FKGRRDKVVINTKCTHFRRADGTLPGEDQLEPIIRNSLVESLDALQTDYVDVFMLHTADEEILANEEITRVFSGLKASGAVRAIGVSTYLPEETARAINSGIWDVIQLPFNLLDQRQQVFFRPAAERG